MPLPRAIAAPGKHGLDDTAPAGHGASLSIGLSAVIVAASVQEPRVLTIRLPSRGERLRTLHRIDGAVDYFDGEEPKGRRA